ncbi:hypothetical protein FJ930_05360 [Mesorhizobium sp. B2-4-15]|uniref:hypothetical protein n=1 Tax=Mesorhizobium sp. B2-4-15 TaxID=2589934 RepID=UPI00114F4A9A|nr:hypothetical protein [Mesorhizobium sp. B2-4-15]TPK75520.1 hypothetical protein FJ930_05360 [Mesorhizobium sp. B2-4-15]
MGRLDKDRFQKELAIRYCLSAGLLPFLEVLVVSSAEVTDQVEVLTDVDVLGVSALDDGRLHKTIFDCKSSTRMSPINRAFWTAGLRQYIAADSAFVLMGSRSSRNHRLAALDMNVDLHDEDSFTALGRSLDPVFPNIEAYQASIDRWQSLEDVYSANQWSSGLREQIAYAVPLADDPKAVFRRIIASLRSARGNFDPKKPKHLAIIFDVMSATFVSLIKITRDLRRIYDPKMDKREFENTLRYYMWGGKEAFNIRQQLASRSDASRDNFVELPAWPNLVNFMGITLDAPGAILDCAIACKEISLRFASGSTPILDALLSERLESEGRTVQFSVALGEYLTKGGNLPTDMQREIEATLYAF